LIFFIQTIREPPSLRNGVIRGFSLWKPRNTEIS
jgi:hypothetical protein